MRRDDRLISMSLRGVALPVAVVGLLALVVALLYGHTLQVPFYLDDHSALERNYLLRDLPAAWRWLFTQRGLTNLTFAVNYRLSDWELAPLHLVNIALHAGNGLLVWCLLRRFFTNPWLPLLGALLFVAHPVQTQGVTYLVQRSTTLAAFLFLMAFLLYLRARDVLVAGHGRRSGAYLRPLLGSMLAGAGAVLAKEHALVLPLVLLVWSQSFPLRTQSRRQVLVDLALYGGASLLAVGPILWSLPRVAGVVDLYAPMASLQHNAPFNYLFTQFQVIWIYLLLLLVPVGQALEHNYPVVAELLNGKSLLGLTGLLLLWGAVWRLRARCPLLAFGIVWFFLTLAVESSVLPLDPLFEHRLYLPMFGFILVLLDGLSAMLGEKRAIALLAVALVLCAPLTWRRNALWNDPTALYEDNLRTVPASERAMETLAVYYAVAERYDAEAQLLEQGRRFYPRNPVMAVNQARAYAERGEWSQALALTELAISASPVYLEGYRTLTVLFPGEEGVAIAIDRLQRMLPEVPAFFRVKLYNQMGEYYWGVGEGALAEQVLREGLLLQPGDPVLLGNLGRVYFAREQWPEAVSTLRQSLLFGPGNPDVLEGLALAASHLGDRETQNWALSKLRYADAPAWQRLQREFSGAGGGGG